MRRLRRMMRRCPKSPALDWKRFANSSEVLLRADRSFFTRMDSYFYASFCKEPGYAQTQYSLSLHRQLLSKPDGRGVGPPSQKRCAAALVGGHRNSRHEPQRRQGDGRGGGGYLRAA